MPRCYKQVSHLYAALVCKLPTFPRHKNACAKEDIKTASSSSGSMTVSSNNSRMSSTSSEAATGASWEQRSDVLPATRFRFGSGGSGGDAGEVDLAIAG